MKTINRIFLLIVIFLSIVTTVKAQETMYIYKDGAVVGEHVLADVDSVIFYQPTHGTITDNDGNEYQTVVIGTQTWMAENLKTTTYNDGTSISNVTDNATWGNVTIGAYCWYDNNAVSYSEPYGGLYNYYTVETDKLCPSGWHVPSKSEWIVLADFLGGKSVAGGKLKETGDVQWISPNTGATNETKFSGLPGGYRMYDGTSFREFGTTGVWWTSSEDSYGDIFYMSMSNSDDKLFESHMPKRMGFSVRCLKD